MTIEVPPTAATTVVETPAKPDETKTEEPTLSIQIEPPTASNENPEDLVTPNEEKQPTSAKRKALFNNPFKVTKKEATTPDTPTAHTADAPKEHVHAEEKAAAAAATATGAASSGTGENKIAKGLGNLYTRIKVNH